jgi:hypothetical protein
VRARVAGAVPLLTIYAWLCLLYGWEAWGNRTPWLFTDELEHAQLARAAASTGRAAFPGGSVQLDSLYAYLIAPAWWIHDTSAAYGTAKAIGIAAMAASIFPAYALARLLVRRVPAIVAATAVASIPAFAYSSLLAFETLAYPLTVLCLWLAVRALTTPTRSWIAAAAVTALIAPTARSELAVLPAAFVCAAALFWFTGEHGLRWRRDWSIGDYVGLGALVTGVFVLGSALASHHSTTWQVATQEYRSRIFEYGVWATGALVIGIGILPLIAALAFFFSERWERRGRADRAFACVAVPTIVAFAVYTGIKASFLSTVFTVTVAERNMIYVAPLLLIASVAYFERRRAQPLVLAGAAALTLYLIVRTPYHMEVHFYADAPGLSILQSANRVLSFTPHDARLALYVVLVLSLAAVTSVVLLRGSALRRVLVATAAFVLAWSLAGEITGARASHQFGNQLLSNFPQPHDWIDRATKRATTLYLSNRLSGDNNGLFLLEFWNRGLTGVASLDGTTSDPRSGYAALTKTDGTLSLVKQSFAPDTTHPDYRYAVTSEGINLSAPVAARIQHYVGGQASPWTLYRLDGPPRLANSTEGVFPDGWFGKVRSYSRDPAFAAYTQFSTPGDRPGYLVVNVSRLGGGQSVPAHVRLKVGTVRLDATAAGFNTPRIDKLLLTRTVHAKRRLNKTFVINAPPAPFRAVVTAFPLFVPAELDPRQSDVRDLAGQVSFRFVPKTPPAVPGKPAEVTGFFPDGWISSDATYTQWQAPYNLPAKIRVTLSRANWTGRDVPSPVHVTVGPVVNRIVDGQVVAVQGRPTDHAEWTAQSGAQTTLSLRTPRPPFVVKVHVDRTFVPSKLDKHNDDTRKLGAQVGFEFVPFG